MHLKAHSHEDELGNEKSNADLWRDVEPHRWSKRLSFDVSSESNTAWSKRQRLRYVRLSLDYNKNKQFPLAPNKLTLLS